MRKISFMALAAGLLAACSGPAEPEGFTINVNFTGDLSKLPCEAMVLSGQSLERGSDTAAIVDGKAVFTGVADTPDNCFLTFQGVKFPFKSIFVENAVFNVSMDAAGSIVEAKIEGGGPVQQFLTGRQQHMRDYQKAVKYDSLIKVQPLEQEKLNEIRKLIRQEGDRLDAEFQAANPTSPFTLSETVKKLEDMSIAEAEAALAEFSALPQYANNNMLKKALAGLEKIKSLQPGQPAPDFTQNDIHGQPVTLSQVYVKHKVTMVDFWASWCGPCRRFNPTLLRIYEKYHAKGLEIIGVSLDNKQDAWEKAVKDDRLSWIHVSDLSRWDNAVGKLYYVHFVPQNIFIGQDGKILGRQLKTEEEIVRLLEENL